MTGESSRDKTIMPGGLRLGLHHQPRQNCARDWKQAAGRSRRRGRSCGVERRRLCWQKPGLADLLHALYVFFSTSFSSSSPILFPLPHRPDGHQSSTFRRALSPISLSPSRFYCLSLLLPSSHQPALSTIIVWRIGFLSCRDWSGQKKQHLRLRPAGRKTRDSANRLTIPLPHEAVAAAASPLDLDPEGAGDHSFWDPGYNPAVEPTHRRDPRDTRHTHTHTHTPIRPRI
jgi:hypothetical protein